MRVVRSLAYFSNAVGFSRPRLSCRDDLEDESLLEGELAGILGLMTPILIKIWSRIHPLYAVWGFAMSQVIPQLMSYHKI